MNVLVARVLEDCLSWTGAAVVVDPFRSATTVCALLAKGERPVALCADEQTAQTLRAQHPDVTILADGKISLPHEDNSPHLAKKLAAQKPALIVNGETGQLLQALKHASLVLLGGFCNFRALVQALRPEQDILLVPATILNGGGDEEDTLCAQAIKESLENISTPGQFLDELASTMRWAELCQTRLSTIKDDLKLALTLDRYSVVPRAILGGQDAWAFCFPLGHKPDAAWVALEEKLPQQAPQKEVFETEEELSLRPMLEKTMLATLGQETPEEKASEIAPLGESKGEKIKKALSQAKDRLGQAKDRLASEKNKKGLKAFFSKLVSSVKEDAQDLEQALSGQPVPSVAPAVRAPAPSAKKAPAQPAPAEKSTSAPKEAGKKKAIVLFSGGLDSTTCLYWALAQGYTCEALSVSYGQRHLREVVSAQAICRQLGIKHHLIELNLPWLATSSLVDENKNLPDIPVDKIAQAGVPSTYVPGRNLMFLSIAGSLLDAVGADAIIAGPNAVDFSGYPDCTPAFFKSAGEALNRGTLRGVHEGIEVLAPLMKLNKAEIVKLAVELNVPLKLTWSCYAGGEKPCGKCDSCKLRAKGFAEAGVHDPALD